MSGSCPWGLLVLGTDAAISGSGKDSPRRRGGPVRPGRAGWCRRAITSPCGLCAEGAWSLQPLPQGPQDGPLVLQEEAGPLLTPAWGSSSFFSFVLFCFKHRKINIARYLKENDLHYTRSGKQGKAGQAPKPLSIRHPVFHSFVHSCSVHWALWVALCRAPGCVTRRLTRLTLLQPALPGGKQDTGEGQRENRTGEQNRH